MGLRLITQEERYGAFLPLKTDVESLAVTGRLHELEGHYAAAWQSRQLLPSGRRLYSSLVSWAVALDESIIRNPTPYLDAFSTQYEATPTPFWAGVYAAALTEIADEIRGDDWAHKVSDKRWALHGDLTRHAAMILDEAGSADGADPFGNHAWLEAAYEVSLGGAPDEQFHGLWERLYALDPANIAVLSSRGIHLLPRWCGQGPHDAEAFARAAIEPARAVLGTGAYAAVYLAYPNIGELDAEDTAVDPVVLKQSFIDLLAHFPGSLELLNEFANSMSWVGDEATVWSIHQQGLRAIEPFSWGGDDEDEGMEYAVNAFDYARDNH